MPADPQKLLDEAKRKVKRRRFWNYFKWWALNRCTNCGSKLLVADNENYFHEPICEWCERYRSQGGIRQYKRPLNSQLFYAGILILMLLWVLSH